MAKNPRSLVSRMSPVMLAAAWAASASLWSPYARAETASVSAPASNELAYSGEVAIVPPSAHSPRFFITVSEQVSAYATGLQLFVRQVMPQGNCTLYTVFNFQTHELTTVDSFGSPSCGSVEAPAPVRLLPGDSRYAAALGDLVAFLRQASTGYYVGSPAEPRLTPSVTYLDALLHSVTAP